jgi:hypothetical protein
VHPSRVEPDRPADLDCAELGLVVVDAAAIDAEKRRDLVRADVSSRREARLVGSEPLRVILGGDEVAAADLARE